jgi:hypothetical protein
MNKIAISLSVWLLGTTTHLQAQGYIVPNGVVYDGLFQNGIGYGIGVVHDPTNMVYTGFALNPVGKTPLSVTYTNTYTFSPIIDVSVRVFLVASNQPISLSPILLNSYTELGNAPSYVFNSGVPFYVGLYTGNQNFYPPNGIYTDPLFGWARLVNNQGVIQLLDSALVYKAEGIFAGTQTIIPEPTSFALIVLSGALFGGCRRKR